MLGEIFGPELLIVLAVILVLFGGSQLPKLARGLGSAQREFKKGLDDEIVAGITHRNAMRHYQFDPFAIRPPERCTAAALRSEAPDVDPVTRVGRPADERDLQRWNQIVNAVR